MKRRESASARRDRPPASPFERGTAEPTALGAVRSLSGRRRLPAAAGEAVERLHMVAHEPEAAIHGEIDWQRRYLLMRVQTAQHVLNGVIWNEYGAHVTGASMTPGEGRLDFELPAMSQEFARAVEAAVNEQIARDLEVRVLFLPRSEADRDPSLMRLKANLIPCSVDPLRVVDIGGLDAGDRPRARTRGEVEGKGETSASASRSKTSRPMDPRRR